MSSFKYMDGSKPIGFVYPFQDLLTSMTEALKEQNFTAYVDLVSHLRNMSILAFDKKDIESLEKIDEICIKCKKHIDVSLRGNLDKASLYNVEDVNSVNYRVHELKTFCEYRFSGVVERICIYALRKTILREQVPEAQSGVYYESQRDIMLTMTLINSVFESSEIKPCEVKL